MKGAVGFLVGIIGLCLFASVSLLIPIVMRRNEGLLVLLLMLVGAFAFLNVMVVGFYRMIGHLHETVLYPDDPHSYPQRGRGLFFTGYVGLLVILVFVVFVSFLPAITRFRFSPRDMEFVLVIAWFVGWIFFGLLLGGILAMLSDVYHKAFYRSMTHAPGREMDDDLDISRRGPRRSVRSSRCDHEDDDRTQQGL